MKLTNIRDLSSLALLRIVLTILACLALAWKVVAAGLAAQAGQVQNPQLMAVFADKKYPDTAAKMAQFLFSTKDYATASETAHAAVLGSPLNIRAVRVYGLALEREGERESAARVLRRAQTMGWRDTPVLVWGLQDAAVREDANRVVIIADALARRQVLPNITRTVFFGSLIEPQLRRPFINSLAARPSWRPTFFNDLSAYLTVPQSAGMEAVLSGLRKTKAPPTPDETLKYVSRLADLGEYRRARSFWARAFDISPGQLADIPFDGRFVRAGRRAAGTPAGPFEWQSNSDLGDEAVFTTDTKNAILTVEPGVPAGTTILSQTVLFAPGAHQMRTIIAQGTGVSAPVGWTIICLPSNQSLLRTLRDANDELSHVGFIVPEKGCSAQSLRLNARDQLDSQAVSISAVSAQ